MVFVKKVGMLVCLSLLFSVSGCMMLCPDPSPVRKTECGRIEFLDYATCSKLDVVDHTCTRDSEGHLVVKVKWYNRAKGDYEAQIRRIFWNGDGHRERGSFRWDLQKFRGQDHTVCSWRSYSDTAAMYKIEVRKAR